MSKPNFWWVLFSRKHVYNMLVAYPMWATLNHMHIVLAKVTHVGDPQHSQRQRNWHGWSGPRSVLLKCLGCWFINGCCFQHAISTRWLLNASRGCSHFTHSFWSPYEYLSHCQSEDFHAHYMLICLLAPPPSPPQLCYLLNLQWSSYFEYADQSLSKTCFFCIHSWSHTKPRTTQI